MLAQVRRALCSIDPFETVISKCLACLIDFAAWARHRCWEDGSLSTSARTPGPFPRRRAEAQRWFDLGLNWCFGFNKEEGVKCFLKALEHDPECAMAHWGAAFGTGPFYNLTWREHGEKEANAVAKLANEHIAKARALSHRATDLENQLVEALARRFQKPHAVPLEEFDRWDDDYAAEMRRVYYNYPDDHDVMALYIEALITRTPRRLWNVKTGAPAKRSDVVEAIQACERSIRMANEQGRPQHPAVVHLHIHAMEMANTPKMPWPRPTPWRRSRRTRAT